MVQFWKPQLSSIEILLTISQLMDHEENPSLNLQKIRSSSPKILLKSHSPMNTPKKKLPFNPIESHENHIASPPSIPWKVTVFSTSLPLFQKDRSSCLQRSPVETHQQSGTGNSPRRSVGKSHRTRWVTSYPYSHGDIPNICMFFLGGKSHRSKRMMTRSSPMTFRKA